MSDDWTDIHSSNFGFCREDGLPYEVHTPEGWLLCGNEPVEKSQQMEVDWREYEADWLAELD